MKRLLLVPIFFFLAFLTGVYLVWPKYGMVRVLQHDVNQNRVELKERQTYFDNLKSTLREINEYKESLTKIDSSLPSGISVASLLYFFQARASENGLILVSINPAVGPNLGPISSQQSAAGQAEKTAARFKEAYFALSLKGSVPSLENFLKSVEKSSRIIDVAIVSINKETMTGLNEFSLLLKVYYY